MRSLLVAVLLFPSPVLAQTVRLSVVEAPALSNAVPALASPLSAPSAALALSPSLVSLAPALSAPSIVPAVVAVPAASRPVRAVPAALGAAVLPAPSTPDKPLESAKADADAMFDAEAAAPAVEPAVAAKSVPGLEAKLAPLGRVKAPNHWVEKGKVLAGYGGLLASSVAMHAPFDRIAPLVIGAIMAIPMAFMWMMFYTYENHATSVPKQDAPFVLGDIQPKPGTVERIARLAKEAGLPLPARVKVLDMGDKVQAMVGNRDASGYEIRFSKAFEGLRPEVQDAIMRHEMAHELHHDMTWQVVKMFLTTLPIMISLLGMTDKPDAFGWLVAAITAASVLMFPASLKHSEYLADQYAASKEEGAAPLARFFVEDSENPERAASALSGTPFASVPKERRRWTAAWDRLKTLFSAHPSHDRRVARLVRLSEKEKGR